MNNIDEDIKLLESFNAGDEHTEKIKQSINNVLSELETYKKIAEKLASATYDYANLEMLNICPAEYEGNVDLRKCKQFGKDINCIKCIIDWAKSEVEKDE